MDLRTFGYDAFSRTTRLQTFLDFTDSGRLAFAWLILDDPADARKASFLTPKPAHLHVLVLDAKTGGKQGLQEWSTPSSPVRFLGIRDGKFLICTGTVFRLFSPSFLMIREQNLPSGHTCLSNSWWSKGPEVSPSSRSVLLSSHPLGLTYKNAIVDTRILTPVATWVEDFPIGGISDHWLVAHCGQQREMSIRGIDKSWRPFQLSEMPMRNVGMLFVSDRTLVIEARNKMAVATVDAEELFRMELPNNRSFGEVVPSGGDRFAVMENRLRGLRNEFLDMYPFDSNDRVVVFSIADRRAIYAVRVKGMSPWRPQNVTTDPLALSPDGILLAVIADGILKVYWLPSGNS